VPRTIELCRRRKINPDKVFGLALPLEQVVDGYRVMDERRAIKALLIPEVKTLDCNEIGESFNSPVWLVKQKIRFVLAIRF
jgi:hypothetical protein